MRHSGCNEMEEMSVTDSESVVQPKTQGATNVVLERESGISLTYAQNHVKRVALFSYLCIGTCCQCEIFQVNGGGVHELSSWSCHHCPVHGQERKFVSGGARSIGRDVHVLSRTTVAERAFAGECGWSEVRVQLGRCETTSPAVEILSQCGQVRVPL